MRARCGRMAACGGGYRSNVHLVQELYATRRNAGFQRSVLQYPVGSGVSLGVATGAQAARRRRWRWAVTWPSAIERPDGRARVAGTHGPSGATAAINPGWSRSLLDAVGGWKLGLLITDFARFINSEIALLCEWQGAATHGDLLVGSGGTYEEIARPLEGGVVGRALHLPQRAALEPNGPSSGDRRVGARVPARAGRAIARRRGRRPRAWGEARGPRTTQSRPLRSRTRGAA